MLSRCFKHNMLPNKFKKISFCFCILVENWFLVDLNNKKNAFIHTYLYIIDSNILNFLEFLFNFKLEI